METKFLWGDDLLVAPVTHKGATDRTLYLPAGGWFDFWTGKPATGGEEVTRPADLATLPLYVRAGSILPLDPVRQFTAEKSTAPLALRIYPGKDGETTLYQDDGRSLGYQRGLSRTTRISWDENKRLLRLEPSGETTYDPGWPREIRVESASGDEMKTVHWDGKSLEIPVP